MKWLVGDWQWPNGALFMAAFLTVLAPAWFHEAGLALTCVYLHMPVYLLHQWEEHTEDRFRNFVNGTVFGGREALTPEATFWINAGVWVVDIVSLYLAVFVDLSLGLIAIYLPLLNSLGHVLPGLARRTYNPGLYTSLALFIPFGLWSLNVVSTASSADKRMHLLAFGIAVAIHAAIIVHVKRRIAWLNSATASIRLSQPG